MKYLIRFFLLALIFSGCTNKKVAEQTTEIALDDVITLTDAQMKNAQIETREIEQKQISSVLKVNGRIDVPPQNLVSISVPLGGYLKTTRLLPGMHINKNQVIAVMEDHQYIQLQQDYLTAKGGIL